MVQAIARQSLKRSSGLAEFGETFETRLTSLARAHAVLTQNAWTGANIRVLLVDQLAPFDESRISLWGSNLPLDPNAAYVVALLVHELAVNAHKYGSLSSPTGDVLLTWSFDPADDALNLEWLERGGPPVQSPQSVGFGTELIQALAGSGVERSGLRYDSLGFVCKLRIPLARSQQESARTRRGDVLLHEYH